MSFNPANYPRTYGLSGGRQVLMWCVMLMMAGFVAAVFYYSDGRIISPLFLKSAPFALPPILLILIYLLRYRVTLTAEEIEVRGIFFTKRLRRDKIRSLRIVRTDPKMLRLELDNGKKTTLSLSIKEDEAFTDWFDGMHDYDAEEKRKSEDKISSNENLGSTPEERLAFAAKAKKILDPVQIAVFLACGVALSVRDVTEIPQAFHAIPFLILGPLAAILIVGCCRGAVGFLRKRNSQRGSVAALAFMTGPAALALMYQQMSWWEEGNSLDPLPIVLCGAGALSAVILSLDAETRKPMPLLLVVGMMFFHAYASVIWLNTLEDKTPPETSRGLVICGKKSGRSSARIDVIWHPTQMDLDAMTKAPPGYCMNVTNHFPPPESEHVTRKFYRDTARIGSIICKTRHPEGALGIAWQKIDTCK